MPVIRGSGRCGSTLLRLMLDGHPELAMPPETSFLPVIHERRAELTPASFADLLVGFPTWPDFHLDEVELRRQLGALSPFTPTRGIRCFYRLYARRFGKQRWGDKTPRYVSYLPAIQELLPEARFVHLIRDGRDVAVSMRRMWFAPGQDAATLARYWRGCIETAREGARHCTHYLEVHFEDLLRNPANTLKLVCDFVELPWDPVMVDYPQRAPGRLAEVEDQRLPDGRVIRRERRLGQHPLVGELPQLDRIGEWRRAMSDSDVAIFDELAGDLLAELGYPGRSPAAG
jgi:hypothetical protein